MMGRLMTETSPEFWARLLKFNTAHHPNVITLAKWAGYFVRRTLRNDRKDGTALVLEGETGTGKTTVGKFCVRAFNDYILDATRADGSQWRKSPLPKATLLNWSKYCRDVDRKETGPWVTEEALQSDVIALDDVGAESDRFKSGAHTAALRDFLEECAHKWLLISTNIQRENWVESFGRRVASRLDASRSFSTAGIPDYRLTQGTRTL